MRLPYGFSSGHVWMWELDCGKSWAPKNWCFWTVVLQKTLASPLDCKEIQPVHSKETSPGCSLERLMLKLQYFGPLMRRVDSLEKTLMLGLRDWGQEEKGTTEDEMAGWHHWLDGHESEWTPGVGDGQGGLACCDSWGHKESETTEWLNWTELNWDYLEGSGLTGLTWEGWKHQQSINITMVRFTILKTASCPQGHYFENVESEIYAV